MFYVEHWGIIYYLPIILVPAALTAADDITMSNDEDGVAHWLKVNCIG